jgi:glycosyltransferase involved in cell wall biosynthesis
MKTIVSATPIAVQRDSRTFKMAASLARLGYRSIVVEGEPSLSLSGSLPFELITVGGRREPADVPDSAEQPGPATDAAGIVAGEYVPPPPKRTRLDVFAAEAPEPLRRTAGPPWRALVRVRRRLPGLVRGAPLRLHIPRQVYGFYAYLRHYASMCREVAATLPEADLYYLHSQLQFPAVWWRSRAGRTPIVYDAHDLYWTIRTDGRPLPGADRAIWAVWDAVERAAAARGRACVTVGEGVARRASEHFGRRFAVIRNAHDQRLDASGVPDLRARIALPDDALLLAVSGNSKRGMAVEPMLKALSQLPERVHIAFLGAGYEESRRLARDIGVADRAHFLDPVKPTEIVPVLKGADLAPVLYHPVTVSIRHALPNGFFHAVAAGVPVLYPRHLVDVRQLCTRLELGWEIDPENYSSIAVTVRRLAEDPDLIARRRAHVRAVRDQLSWEREERELERVVTGALNGRVG